MVSRASGRSSMAATVLRRPRSTASAHARALSTQWRCSTADGRVSSRTASSGAAFSHFTRSIRARPPSSHPSREARLTAVSEAIPGRAHRRIGSGGVTVAKLCVALGFPSGFRGGGGCPGRFRGSIGGMCGRCIAPCRGGTGAAGVVGRALSVYDWRTGGCSTGWWWWVAHGQRAPALDVVVPDQDRPAQAGS